MSRSWLLLALLAVKPAYAQEDPVFRTEISLVKVDAEVAGKSGVVDGLSREDFVVLDNGQPQRVRYFSQEEEPLDIILLFDISESMGPSIQKVASSARLAMSELRQGDRVAVMSFNTGVWTEAPFTADLDSLGARIVQRIRETRFAGGTYILSAVDQAAKYLLHQPAAHRRRAVLIFTDDEGYGSTSPKVPTRDLWDADAVLSGLIIPADRGVAPFALTVSGDDYVEKVAGETGGEVVKAEPPGPAFRDMLIRMRKRYTLYYPMPPGKPGQIRKVAVDLSPSARKRYPDAAVLARKGYIVR
ncbi:MAG: VWA domain-containing protein [Bryobacteraceae bacterium]|jgi:Ca-activated chloride channel homolog